MWLSAKLLEFVRTAVFILHDEVGEDDGPIVQSPGHACCPVLGGDGLTDAVGDLVEIKLVTYLEVT